MHLQGFAREMIKEAKLEETLVRHARWLFTKKVKPNMFGSQAGQAKKVLNIAGKKLDRETADKLEYIAAGKTHPQMDPKKVISEASKKHDVREFSITKPAILAGGAVGTVAGMRRNRKDRRIDTRISDRAPQLTQDPSRVLY